MADRSFDDASPLDAAALEARLATAALFAKLAADRRRARLRARLGSREILVDLVVAMATYTGVTIAVILGAIYGIRTTVGLLIG